MTAANGSKRQRKTATRRPEGIRLLLAGQTSAQVAAALDVGKRTVGTWKASDAYTEALAAKNAKVAEAIEGDSEKLAKLTTRGIDAVVVLLDGITAMDVADQVRVVAEVRQWTIGNKHRVAGDPDNPMPVALEVTEECEQAAARLSRLLLEETGANE